MIDACCDANFTKAVTECWNVTHGRASLSSHKIQLKQHKALLRKLSNSSIPIKHRKIAFQSGSGFASLLPLLLGPIVVGIFRLIKPDNPKHILLMYWGTVYMLTTTISSWYIFCCCFLTLFTFIIYTSITDSICPYNNKLYFPCINITILNEHAYLKIS